MSLRAAAHLSRAWGRYRWAKGLICLVPFGRGWLGRALGSPVLRLGLPPWTGQCRRARLVLFVMKARGGAQDEAFVQLPFQRLEPLAFLIVEKGDHFGVGLDRYHLRRRMEGGLLAELPQDV